MPRRYSCLALRSALSGSMPSRLICFAMNSSERPLYPGVNRWPRLRIESYSWRVYDIEELRNTVNNTLSHERSTCMVERNAPSLDCWVWLKRIVASCFALASATSWAYPWRLYLASLVWYMECEPIATVSASTKALGDIPTREAISTIRLRHIFQSISDLRSRGSPAMRLLQRFSNSGRFFIDHLHAPIGLAMLAARYMGLLSEI